MIRPKVMATKTQKAAVRKKSLAAKNWVRVSSKFASLVACGALAAGAAALMAVNTKAHVEGMGRQSILGLDRAVALLASHPFA